MGGFQLPQLSQAAGFKVSMSLLAVRVAVDSTMNIVSTGLPTTTSLVVGGITDIGTRVVDVVLTHNPFTAVSLALSGVSYTGTGIVNWLHSSHKDRAETLSLHVNDDGNCVGIHDPQIASLMQANAKQLSPEAEARLLYAFDWMNEAALLVDFAGGIRGCAQSLAKTMMTAGPAAAAGMPPFTLDEAGGDKASAAGGDKALLLPEANTMASNVAYPIYGATAAGGAFTLTAFLELYGSNTMYRDALRTSTADQQHISDMFVRVVKQCVGDNGQRPENEQRFLAHQFPDCKNATVTATTETHIKAILAGECTPFNFEAVQQQLLNKKLQNQTTVETAPTAPEATEIPVVSTEAPNPVDVAGATVTPAPEVPAAA